MARMDQEKDLGGKDAELIECFGGGLRDRYLGIDKLTELLRNMTLAKRPTARGMRVNEVRDFFGSVSQEEWRLRNEFWKEEDKHPSLSQKWQQFVRLWEPDVRKITDNNLEGYEEGEEYLEVIQGKEASYYRVSEFLIFGCGFPGKKCEKTRDLTRDFMKRHEDGVLNQSTSPAFRQDPS